MICLGVKSKGVEFPTVDQQNMKYTKAKYKICFYNRLAQA